ncbi:MAG: gamma-glutamyl-gamma-aminobutyrate hydrolase family protein [Bacillota bacterium]|jgi:putative glutamine amidotransferase|nr:gamma-glutamyl-gamma-aminobutyrate hydrolase family protein [Candidatus Fermentithermobacillaceae bacterium]
MRPIIGITATYNEEHNAAATPMTYIEAVLEAGGKPLLIPVMPQEVAEENLSVIDALLIPGGVDVDPRHYNERPIPQLGRINPLLDELELGLARKALEMNMPMLGICRGCQIITVAAGGSLVQDIGSQVGGAQKHSQQAARWYGTHEVVLAEGSLFERVHKTRRLWVNSYHHQSIKHPGDGFSVTAHALDGVAEGAERNKGFCLCIQWHPEAMWRKNPVFLEPFKALVRAAKGEEI